MKVRGHENMISFIAALEPVRSMVTGSASGTFSVKVKLRVISTKNMGLPAGLPNVGTAKL